MPGRSSGHSPGGISGCPSPPRKITVKAWETAPLGTVFIATAVVLAGVRETRRVSREPSSSTEGATCDGKAAPCREGGCGPRLEMAVDHLAYLHRRYDLAPPVALRCGRPRGDGERARGCRRGAAGRTPGGTLRRRRAEPLEPPNRRPTLRHQAAPVALRMKTR